MGEKDAPEVTPEMLEAACRKAQEYCLNTQNVSLQDPCIKRIVEAALKAAQRQSRHEKEG